LLPYTTLFRSRLQLLQATDRARLAYVRRFLGLRRRAVRRDVRLSADDLLAVRVAADALSEPEPAGARQRASVVDAAWLGRRPARQSAAHCELRSPRARLLAAVRRVERALRRAAQRNAGDYRPLCTGATPAVRRLRPDPPRVPAAVADGA